MYGIIYKITNINNGKVYIGQTIQTVEKRAKEHIYRALYSKTNTKICNAIRKYGKESFLFETIDNAENAIELDTKEIEYIKKYNSIEDGYNILNGGLCSDNDADLMAIQCGSQPFYAFDLKGKFIGEFISKRAFEREYGVAAAHVADMINNKMYHCNGYIIIDKEEYTLEVLNSRIERAKRKDRFEAIDKITNKSMGIFENKEECKRILGLHKNTHISEVLSGKRKSSGGYIFKYVEES